MKLAKIILAVALPLALSAGCAMDVGSSADGLTTELNNDFGINLCGQTINSWMGDSEWPIDTIVAGDMEFTKEDLVEYMQTYPGFKAELMAEMAAVQLNMAVGLTIPDSVLDGLIAADDYVMANKNDDGSVPPPVALDDFESLRSFNRYGAGICQDLGADVAEVADGVQDIRDGIFEETPGNVDVRVNLATKD
jgi:hypothetical protein